MLGYVLGITLVLTALSPLVFTGAFADSFVVNFDKQFYDVNDSLTISGEVTEIGMPIIAMSIYDPDGKILSANNLEISSEKTFTKTILLNPPFYEKIGEYLIKLDYGKVSENHYFIIEGEFSDSEILIESSEDPEIILLYTEQKQYTDKDVIKITGLVSVLDSPSVLIGIYDPFGMPAGFYFGSIDSNLEFTTSFLAKDGVNFRVDGTYSIKAHYAETETISFFEYSKDSQITIEEPVVKEPVVKEPVVKEPVVKEPVVKEPVVKEPVVKEPVVKEPVVKEPVVKEPVVKEPVVKEPVVKEPVVKEPVVKEPVVKEPVVKEPVVKEPVVKEPVVKEPVVKEPVVKEPYNEIKKQNNLTVEDVELGKLLNQINLKCDSSIFIDTISYYDGMGPALYRLCQFDNALNFFNESLINNPDDIEILVNKGSTLGKLGYFSEAIVYYDHAINIDPNFLAAKNNKANTFANMGNLNSAILLYDEILAQNPDNLTAHKNLKTALSLTSNLSENSSESSFQNISIQKSSLSEKINTINSEKQKPDNFFDEVNTAFSTLSSLFNFLN